MSALTKNQVVAFVLTVTACFLFTVSGLPLVLDFFQAWAPQGLVSLIAGLSFLTHFSGISQGVIDLSDLVYFLSVMALFLFLTMLIVDTKREAG